MGRGNEAKDHTTKKSDDDPESNGLFAASSFADLGLHPTLCQHLQDKMGFKVPTVIQAKAIPEVISGRHVLVNAATGTGKTIVYLAPIVHLLQMRKPQIQRSDGTFALVLVPTRELCIQVYEILQKLVHRFHWIVPGYVMGGESRSKEKARLRKGISVLIATPGRLLDHLKNTSSFSYKMLQWIVFDEADSILELGFGKEIEEILDFFKSREESFFNKRKGPCKNPRQNLLLSATLNEKVNHLANISLDNPVMIGLEHKIPSNFPPLSMDKGSSKGPDKKDEANNVHAPLDHFSSDYNLPGQLVQRFAKVPCGLRLVILVSILKNLFERDTTQKVVVFFSTCDTVNFHHSLLSQFYWPPNSQVENKQKTFVGCKVFRLHGNMEHEDRRTTFHGFSSEKSALLLCTDIAARGLDFPKVRCIIQYDSPGEATEYVHRAGRTARLGEKGDAILFLQPVEIDYLHDLEKHGVSLKEFPLQKVIDSFPLHGQKHFHKNMLTLDMHPWVLALQKALEMFVSNESNMQKLAKDAFCSWVRAYTAHRGHLKSIFMVKKLHLGHVARSFGLKDQPSLVGRTFKLQEKKRKRNQKLGVASKRRRNTQNKSSG